jgi:hypothetical protein
MAHLGPIQHRICGVLQSGNATTQILDVVEVTPDRLADDVGRATQLSRAAAASSSAPSSSGNRAVT